MYMGKSGSIKFFSLFLVVFLHVSRPGSEVSVSCRVRGLGAGNWGANCFWEHVGGCLCCRAGVVGTRLRVFIVLSPYVCLRTAVAS